MPTLHRLIHLSQPSEAPSVLMLWPSRDEISIEAPNGLQHIQYGAAKLGTAHLSIYLSNIHSPFWQVKWTNS